MIEHFKKWKALHTPSSEVRGQKEGQKLTDYEAGMRSGYLQCQSDHAGLYIYKKALNEGKTKQEAKKLSRIKGKHKGGNK